MAGASHRALDPERSLPYRPYHPHESEQPLTPGEIVSLDVEIWPTSVVVPAGYRLALTVQGRDFEFPGEGPWPATYGVEIKGHGMFLHPDPNDRPANVFGGTTTLWSGPEHLAPAAAGDPARTGRSPIDPARPIPPMIRAKEPPIGTASNTTTDRRANDPLNGWRACLRAGC